MFVPEQVQFSGLGKSSFVEERNDSGLFENLPPNRWI
jgi:hypothetical protein